MTKTAEIVMCFSLAVVAGCQPSNSRKAALQGTVYYGHANSIEPEDTQYVTGTAYVGRSEGVEFEEPRSGSSSHLDRSESERKYFEWIDRRFAETPKEWEREGVRHYIPKGVGPVQHTAIEDRGQFIFTDLEPGAYIVWFEWKYGEVRSGNLRRHQGPREGRATPFRVDIEEGKVVRKEFRLTPGLDVVIP